MTKDQIQQKAGFAAIRIIHALVDRQVTGMPLPTPNFVTDTIVECMEAALKDGEAGWISVKPELNKECVLLTANYYRHPKYPENSYWSYRLFEITKIDSDEGWYWGVLEEGMEWGDIADIKADLYQIVTIPKPESHA